MVYVLSVLIVVLIVVIGLLVVSFQLKQKRTAVFTEENYDLKAITIAEIDKMEDGSGFEMYLYRLFMELGYFGVYKTLGAAILVQIWFSLIVKV